MTEIILLIIIMCIASVNMLMLMDNKDIPQHTVLDKYNDERKPSIEERISSNKDFFLLPNLILLETLGLLTSSVL